MGTVQRMSDLGQSRRFDLLTFTSGLRPTPDISGPGRHFALGPKADLDVPNGLVAAWA